MRNLAVPGEKRNRLVLIRREGKLWIARCDCGQEISVSTSDFRSGHTGSCGCLRKDIMRRSRRTHGKSHTAEFRIWCHMLGRCYNETDHKYRYYGARGIKVCDEWHSFENFYADMGDKPSANHSLDRVDNDAGYSASNCRWATGMQQAQNKRNNVAVIVQGERMVVAAAERALGIGGGSISQRVRKNGETHQQATDYFTDKMLGLGGAQPAGNA